MSLYDKFYPGAVMLLDKFGVQSTITRHSPSAEPTVAQKFNRSTRTVPSAVTITTMAALVDGDDVADQHTGIISNRTITVMLDEPRVGDTLTIGALVLKIIHVTIIAPQGQAIIYEAEVE